MKTQTAIGLLGAAALGLGLFGAAACSTNPKAQQRTAILRSDLPRNENPAVSAADYQALIAGNTEFAFDLYAELGNGNDKNLVYSPISASVGLAMAYAGARGDTATQMAKALHFDLPQSTLHLAFDKLTLQLASRNIANHTTGSGDKSVELSQANALWAQSGLHVLSPFLDTLATNYDAGVRVLDFAGDPGGAREAINGWVSDQTHGRITDLLRPNDVTPDIKLVLTDALYFRASWDHVFNKASTAPAAFHTLSAGDVNVPTMHESTHLRYATGDGFVAVDLPYDGGKLALRIVLPAAGRFEEIRTGLSADWMRGIDQSMQSGPVWVTLPRFKFDWGTVSLAKPLEALGMTDAFGPAADFSGMTATPLHIKHVLQKATISVDESGTEATAATAVEFADAGLPVNPLDFVADRPFLFFIRDDNGTLLFMGQVMNPAS